LQVLVYWHAIGLLFLDGLSIKTHLRVYKKLKPSKMKSIAIFSFTLALSFVNFHSKSQDLTLWPKDTLDLANTAVHSAYLTVEEKKIIQLMNLARLNGNGFVKRIAAPYIEKNQFGNDEYVQTLYADLRSALGLHPLKPLEKLWESAAHHAYDMGHKGLIGHESSDGTTHIARMHRYHQAEHMNESLCYGYSEAIEIVMQLLLDEAIPLRTNRHNILKKHFHHVGVSIKPHREYDHNCVIDFSSL
jgi:uncharacterized protein YkwD